MGQILKAANDNHPFNINGTIVMPCIAIPSCRVSHAIENKIQKKFLIRSFGGLGDQVCAEPAIRYAINHFKDCEISVQSLTPSLYAHLPLKGNFEEKELSDKDREAYYCHQTMHDSEHLAWEFMCHMSIHCVDYPALNMWRSQIPKNERNVVLLPNAEVDQLFAHGINRKTDVVIHPGRNWQSKTFPKEFWDNVLSVLIEAGARPILIGGKSVFDDKGGTVDVNTQRCIDLRNLMSVMQTTALLQKAKVLLTNDSAPLHLAASGQAWIGFISTIKHPDYITHWRKTNEGQVEFGWRMENLGIGGMWETMNLNPNHTDKVLFNQVDENLLKTWLPSPRYFADWAIERLR